MVAAGRGCASRLGAEASSGEASGSTGRDGNAERFLCAGLPELHRASVRAARNLPGLDAEDLRQAAILEFLERQQQWFAHPFDGPRDRQGWTLLRLAMRHEISRHVRDPGRRRDGVEVVAVDRRTPERALLRRERLWAQGAAFERAVLDLEPAVYRLVLCLVDLPRLLEDSMFEAAAARGRGPFRRPWQEVARLARDAPEGRAERRRYLALCLRTAGCPSAEGGGAEARRATGWLDRNASRARAALARRWRAG